MREDKDLTTDKNKYRENYDAIFNLCKRHPRYNPNPKRKPKCPRCLELWEKAYGSKQK